VYEAGSVSRAAAKLHLTQPAISHALGRLRATLGDDTEVPGRGGRHEDFRLFDRALDDLDGLAELFIQPDPPILRRLQTDAPHLSVEVNEIAVSDLLRLLQIGPFVSSTARSTILMASRNCSYSRTA
jgi:hypothetical protein